MFGTAKWIAIATVVIAVIGAAGGFAWHYNGLIEDRARLRVEAAELREGLDSYRAQAEALSAAMNEMTDVAIAAQDEKERLDALFRKHDLGRLTRAKPGPMADLINDGTARILGLLEQATGDGDD